MRIYKNSAELKGVILKHGDIISWPISCPAYRVSFLLKDTILLLENVEEPETTGECGDVKVFKVLGIQNPVEFCKKCYGHDPYHEFIFPVPRRDDYEALSRLVVALMQEAEKIANKNFTNDPVIDAFEKFVETINLKDFMVIGGDKEKKDAKEILNQMKEGTEFGKKFKQSIYNTTFQIIMRSNKKTESE